MWYSCSDCQEKELNLEGNDKYKKQKHVILRTNKDVIQHNLKYMLKHPTPFVGINNRWYEPIEHIHNFIEPRDGLFVNQFAHAQVPLVEANTFFMKPCNRPAAEASDRAAGNSCEIMSAPLGHNKAVTWQVIHSVCGDVQ